MPSIYGLPSDNIISLGSPTLHTGTAATGYGLAKAYDLRPDWPFKPTTVGPIRITGDWGSARTLGQVTLHNILMDAGAAVVFQMHSAPITSSTSDITVPIVMPVKPADRRPNPWADLSTQVAKRYWSLFFPANSVIPSFGEIAIWGTQRLVNVRPNVKDPSRRPDIDHSTEEEVSTIYDHGVTVRQMSAEVMLDATADAAFMAWWESAKGRVNPVLFILDTAVNDARLIRLPKLNPHERLAPLLSQSSLDMMELSPGVPV